VEEDVEIQRSVDDGRLDSKAAGGPEGMVKLFLDDCLQDRARSRRRRRSLMMFSF
jgi:hypothetical protein